MLLNRTLSEVIRISNADWVCFTSGVAGGVEDVSNRYIEPMTPALVMST